MESLLKHISLCGIIPVVVVDTPEEGLSVASALIDGGLHCMEVTFRTDGASKAIQLIAEKYPSMQIGAGTILTVEQAASAIDAGGKFIVSPGLNRSVVEYCRSRNIPIIPGVATPTDIETALDLGVEVLKLFPAEPLGGVEYVKALGGPYKKVKFIPTGGIQQSTFLSFLNLHNVAACGGSWMVRPEWIKSGAFGEITKSTAVSIEIMLGLELTHLGINTPDESTARSHADAMSALVHRTIREGSSSIFVGNSFEFTKSPFPGKHGHIALGTQSIERAVYFLEQRGYHFDVTKKSEKNGKLISMYLDIEIGGFAIHLLQL